MKQFWHVIRESLNGNTNDPSTIRIQSYLIIVPILLCMLTFLTIEVFAFIHAIKLNKEYRISNEIIIVFGMILSHHLAVLFSRNKSQSLLELKGSATDANVTSTTTNTSSTDSTTQTTQINS